MIEEVDRLEREGSLSKSWLRRERLLGMIRGLGHKGDREHASKA